MKFLPKPAAFLAAHCGLTYPGDRKAAIQALVSIQHGFCAYSERRLKPLDSVEIEHFDPRLKGTDRDGIANWHAVVRWMNAHKSRRTVDHLPLPDPQDESISDRITSRQGALHPLNPLDTEIVRLLNYLGANKPEVVEERQHHLGRIRRLMQVATQTGDDLRELIPVEELSFATSLETELDLPAGQWIAESASRLS